MTSVCDETRARLAGLAERVATPFPAGSVPDGFRRAAVLLLVGCQDGEPTLVLTERSSRLRSHAGEIALPGGRLEPGEAPEAAAVREAAEEVGVDPAAVVSFGRLDEAWSKARNHVVPVVGWYGGELARLSPASEEVAASSSCRSPRSRTGGGTGSTSPSSTGSPTRTT